MILQHWNSSWSIYTTWINSSSGGSNAVSDMNALANITSDISALADALEQTYTITVANVGGKSCLY